MAQEKGRDSKDGKEPSTPRKGDENYEFIPPDFDEDAFIHKELVSFRTTLILFLWAIVAAAVAWAAFAAMGGAKAGWLVGLGIAAVFFLGLKRIFTMLKVDIKHFGRREWLGTAALFFFTWLSFFIIAINPPVSDFAPPRVALVPSPATQTPDGMVAIHLFVEDNVALDSHSFELTSGGQPIASTSDLVDLGHGHYRYDASGLPPGTYVAHGSGVDSRGHTGNNTATFGVSEGLIDYSATAGGTLSGAADRVLVKVPGTPTCPTNKQGQVNTHDVCVRTVRLESTSGGNVTLKWNKEEAVWVATTAHHGWSTGNNTF
ncbi:MAG: hypothetical protein QOC71_1746, partial [Thermoplasmata archaeon]|nr:hypothetical protein [Thermoplasmata archaeon]